ncbi:integrase core domain-containing protein [Brevibacterium sp. CBA3109]|uniref:integrase core domain-containing protein n=1 Tax=Brevibacterium koreense TaxID=3140787 RepID=UPI003305EFB1
MYSSQSLFCPFSCDPVHKLFDTLFENVDTARSFIDEYVQWYNTEHRHSGIAHFTPSQVHEGSWEGVWTRRQEVLDAYYAQHPERFSVPPRTHAPAEVVGINHREKNALAA